MRSACRMACFHMQVPIKSYECIESLFFQNWLCFRFVNACVSSVSAVLTLENSGHPWSFWFVVLIIYFWWVVFALAMHWCRSLVCIDFSPASILWLEKMCSFILQDNIYTHHQLTPTLLNCEASLNAGRKNRNANENFQIYRWSLLSFVVRWVRFLVCHRREC